MKISIENFKSIRSLQNFDLKPFTILSGVNSAGKSSFVQLLLLLKQTIELDSSKQPFLLNGDFYKVRDFKDVVLNKNLQNKIKFSFEFNKNEIKEANDKTLNIYNYLDSYSSKISIQLDFRENEIFVDEFNVIFKLPDGNKSPFICIRFNDEKNKYSIEANDNLFGEKIWNEDLKEITVNFLSFYPLYFENDSKNFIKIDWVKKLINSFFQNISYIAPNRNSPEDGYSFSKRYNNVGIKGENVAQILEEYAEEPTKNHEIIETENKISYKEKTETLIEAVKYWMCVIFKVAKDIKAEKVNDTYKITLTNTSNIDISIKHVGFGISQLLPIVVEGLRMPNTGTLIIEQPEIHLHPKIQSKLYDFLYGLTLQGKKVIVETHSSHFITRMRRRITEDESNEMDDKINLTFIENDIFRTIGLDDFGIMDYYPDDFIESSDIELRAIIKAQMNKRMKKK